VTDNEFKQLAAFKDKKSMTQTKFGKFQKAQKFSSPKKVVNDRQDAMNNQYLNKNSEVFVDDTLERIEKRCFFFFGGKTLLDSAISIDLSVNVFDDPAIK
jgi:hypothetical protein